MLLLSAALASDPSPALFTPSVGLGDPRAELVTIGSLGATTVTSGQLGLNAVVRLPRVSAGGDLGLDLGGGQAGAGWLAVSVVERENLRVSPFVKAGTWAQAGLSVAWRVYTPGFRRRGLEIDVSGGPTLDVRQLGHPTWGGPLDRMRSMPEVGLGTQITDLIHLRLGSVGPAPVFRYRVQTGRRTALVYEMTLGGLPGYGVFGAATIGIGRPVGAVL
ncbi:MAG: hypothetical protein R3F61_05865 [Myxococcota bacterium]